MKEEPAEVEPTEPEKSGLPRREFLRLSGVAATGIAIGRLPAMGGVAAPGWFVAADPQLTKEWRAGLWERGGRTFVRGNDLKFIGMPVGGICAGQVYLGGDGRLWLWDVFNQVKFGTVPKQVPFRGDRLHAGGGANYVAPPEQVHPFEQGFAIRLNGKVRTLDGKGWSDVSFAGEYPIGLVEYRDPGSPVRVSLEAFSPFIPLDADDSGLPATMMRFTIRNDGKERVSVSIGGWLQNAIGLHTMQPGEGSPYNRIVTEDGITAVEASLRLPPKRKRPVRPPIVFEDFEKPTYEGWTVEGTAFGPGPRERTKLATYQGNVGGKGQRVVNTHNILKGEDVGQADTHLGRLLSREFTIERHYIEFFIGGGNHPGKTCVNLLVDGKVVRTQTGPQSDQMRLANFKVEDLAGKSARIEVLDQESGGWGQIAVDHIVFTDEVTEVPLESRPDFGTMTLAVLGQGWSREALHPDNPAESMFDPAPSRSPESKPIGAVGRELTLEPGKSETVTFAVGWHFPNLTLNRLGKVGNFYSTRFFGAVDVAKYIAKHEKRLVGLTQRWRDTWYDSTLPRWFLDRTMANTSILASMTCVRFANGRFYGWEGIGCCDGTCGHVWQYAHSVARLFPSLERSVREMVDFGVAFNKDSGLIDFRGEYGNGYAADAQAGYVLRAYREHQMAADDQFLRRNWPQAKKALEYLIEQDADADGILEGRQHNTLDVDLYGPSSWLTSLYLAALRAGEEMAKEMKDSAFARRCRALFNLGAARYTSVFWNGDYFIQRLNPREHPEGLRYGNGCEIDQVMGQSWSWQLGLGRISEPAKTKQALKALYRHNFRTKVGPYRDKHKPGRWYAMPDEPGLLLCTFPQGDRDKMLGPTPTWAHMYFNECWTGTEYQAAGHMIAEGLVEEGLAVTKAVHDRHSPSRRNPYNEVECSDHYARAMASYGVFVTACGYEYHGPKGHLAFAPRISPEDFRAPFTAAEGWGTYRQKITAKRMEAGVHVKHGRMRLTRLSLTAPRAAKEVQVTVGNKPIATVATHAKGITTLEFKLPLTLSEGQEVVVKLTLAE